MCETIGAQDNLAIARLFRHYTVIWNETGPIPTGSNAYAGDVVWRVQVLVRSPTASAAGRPSA